MKEVLENKHAVGMDKLGAVEKSLLIFLLGLVLLGYALPSLMYRLPFGTDAFTHIEYTGEMAETYSMNSFYTTAAEKKLHPEWAFNTFNYPFGLWLLGATVIKLTGIDLHTLAYLLPLFLLVGLISVFYIYAKRYDGSTGVGLLAIIFLLSMPVILLDLLEYRPSVFVMPFTLIALYFMLDTKKTTKTSILLSAIMMFLLIISHTGTYIFFINFLVIYLAIYAVIWGKLEKKAYILIGLGLIMYVLANNLFPNIHYQYLTKSGGIIENAYKIADLLKIEAIRNVADLFYNEVFLKISLAYALILWSLLGTLCEIGITVRNMVPTIDRTKGYSAIPIIGNIQNISHSIAMTPFWIGPIQSILTIPAIMKLDSKGKCIFLTTAITAIYPSMTSGGGGTGVLRYVSYTYLILPITAAIGFMLLYKEIEKSGRIKKIGIMLLILAILSGTIVSTTIANTYYLPTLSIQKYEKDAITWLGSVGEINERVVAPGYRDRIPLYSGKIDLKGELENGGEVREFARNLVNVFFSAEGENNVISLYTNLRAKYYISSSRAIGDVHNTEGLTEKEDRNYKVKNSHLDSNEQLDLIFKGKENFSIYEAIPPRYRLSYGNTTQAVHFAGAPVTIVDLDTEHGISTEDYKLTISKSAPKINYFGTKTKNFFESGTVVDYVTIAWNSGPQHGKPTQIFYLDDLIYPTIKVNDNEIIYETTLKNPENENEKLATLKVTYTFYQGTIKQEVMLANDWNPWEMRSSFRTRVGSGRFSQFWQKLDGQSENTNTIFACNTTVNPESPKFNRIFLNDGEEGIYFKYENTGPYPTGFWYKGIALSQDNILHLSEIKSELTMTSGDSVTFTRYIGVGSKENAEEKIAEYASIKKYNYPYGKHPIVITSDIDRLGTMEDKQFTNVTYIHEKLKEIGINEYAETVTMYDGKGLFKYSNYSQYGESVTLGTLKEIQKDDSDIDAKRMNKLKGYNIEIGGYGDISMPFDNSFEVQKKRLEIMKENAKKYYNLELKGFRAPSLDRNLNTLQALEDLNFSYDTSIVVGYENNEGRNTPRHAYVYGNISNLILMPIASPTDSALGAGCGIGDKVEPEWKNTVDRIIKEDELGIFLWQSSKVGSANYIDMVLTVAAYMKNSDVDFFRPIDIVEHYKKMENVKLEIEKEEKSTKIILINENEEEVKGATITATVPILKNGCKYQSTERIERVTETEDGCKYYISTDLPENSNKTIVITQIN